MWCHFQIKTPLISNMASNFWWQNPFYLNSRNFLKNPFAISIKGHLKNQNQVQSFSNNQWQVQASKWFVISQWTFIHTWWPYSIPSSLGHAWHFGFNKTMELIFRNC